MINPRKIDNDNQLPSLLALENIPVPVYLLSADGRIQYTNKQASRLLGYTHDELCEMRLFDLDTTLSKDEFNKLWLRVLEDGQHEYKSAIINKQGESLSIQLHCTSFNNQNSDYILATAIIRSGSSELFQTLANDSNQFFQSLLDSIPAAVYYKDTDFRYRACNSEFIDLLERSEEEIIGKTVFDLIDKKSAQRHHNIDKDILKHKRSFSYEQRLNSPKRPRHAIFHKACLTDQIGDAVGIIGVIIDITEHKQTERNLEHEHALLASLIDTIPDMIFLKNTEHEYIGCNKAFSRYSGLSEKDLIGKKELQLLPHEVSSFNLEQERKIFETKESLLSEEWIPYKEGGGGLYETIKTPFFNDAGSIKGLIGISRDITERRKTETKLQHLSDLDGYLVVLSKQLFTIKGEKKLKNAVNKALNNIGTACRLDSCSVMRLESEAALAVTEYQWERTDTGQVFAKLQPINTDTIPSILKQLRKGKSVSILDSSELDSRYNDDFQFFENRNTRSALFIPMLESGKLSGFLAFETRKFRRIWLDEEIQVLQLMADLISAFKARSETMQELEKSRNELSEANLKLLQEQQLFVGGPAMVFRWDAKSNQPVQYCTENIQTILGYTVTELLNGDILFTDLLHPDERERVTDEVKYNIDNNIDTFEQEYRLQHSDGSYHHFYDFTRVIRDEYHGLKSLHGYLLDITNQKRAEEERQRIERELRQAQKMEALGQFSGSIAHEFNNMLSVILGHQNLLNYDLEHKSVKTSQHLKHIETAALRAKNLASQLLTFSRPQKTVIQRVDMSSLVDDTITLSRATLPSSINIIQQYNGNIPDVFADPGEIQQLLMNLIVNARDAMGSKGDLSIGIQSTRLKETECQSCHAVIEGKWLEVSVSDTGCGIPENKLDRIFDPFFTSKPVGEGTGLGLSVVRSIMENNNGHILVESRLNHGTRFRLLFPISEGTESQQPDTALNKPQLSFPSLQARVLLVDDEIGLTEFLSEVLQRCGVSVTSVNDSLEAKDLIFANPEQFDLIISDQTMPGMTGLELAAEIKNKLGDIPFLLCSGYSSAEDKSAAAEIGIDGILEKPVSTGDLISEIQKLLAQTEQQSS